MTGSNTVVVAISGPTSSGKSTLTRNLHKLFPNSIILYQDDFYLPDEQVPIDDGKNGLQNWDCPEAFDLAYMKNVLDHVKVEGKLPDKFTSLEETQTLGPNSGVDDDVDSVGSLYDEKLQLINNDPPTTKFVFVDGILLFHETSPLFNSFDLKLFLRAPYSELKKRREARPGYTTLEGFWTDPPGYFDDLVWPEYVDNHKHLFVNNNIDGPLTEHAKNELAIHTPDELNWTPKKTLDWATNKITSTCT